MTAWLILDRPFLVEKTEMVEKGARMLESKYFDEQLFKNCLVKLSKFEVKDWANRQPHHHNWWDQFVEDLVASDLEEICHQVLDLYMQVSRL